jgi:membrane protease YdiL (CAAX protease family)
MKINIKKNYNLLLITGLALFVLGMVLNVICNLDASVEDNPILGQIIDLNGWLFIITTVIIAPILEEFSFRSWTIKKKWTKYLCLGLSTGIISISFNIYAGIFFVLAFSAIKFLLNEKPKTQTYSYVVLTSLGFALCHYENLDLLNYLVAFPMYFGLALVLCYIALRFKFRYAILTHALYNFSLMLLGGFIIPYGGEIVLNDGNYTGKLNSVSGLYSYSDSVNMIGGKTTNIYRKTLPQIASSLIDNNFDFQYKTYPKDYSLYNLNVVGIDSCGIDLRSLFKEIVKKGNLRVDTISEIKTVYFLTVKDIEKIKVKTTDPKNKDFFDYNQLEYIISGFAESQDIIIRVPEELKEVKIKYNIAFYSKNMKPLVKLPEALKNVEKEYGFILTPKQAEVKTIRLFEED